jgi:mRNA-degrading endonuclease toxin of MazEF toxin-antitoxin module
VAKRAEVLVSLRKLGFGVAGRREHFVVLQSDALAGLDTVVVAPLDEEQPMYERDPLVVRVAAAEAGTLRPHVVLVHLVTAARLDRFEPAAVGRLSSKSMGLVEQRLRTALHL